MRRSGCALAVGFLAHNSVDAVSDDGVGTVQRSVRGATSGESISPKGVNL